MGESLMCIWAFSIVNDYRNTTFRKQTAFVFRCSTILRISSNLKAPKTYKFIRERQIIETSKKNQCNQCSLNQWRWKNFKYASLISHKFIARSPTVFCLFPISCRRRNTEHAIVLPICTASVAVRAIYNYCGIVFGRVSDPQPMCCLDTLALFHKATLSFFVSVCLSVRLHGRIFVRWRLVFVGPQCGTADDPSGAWNFEIACTFLDNLYTALLIHTNINETCPTDKLKYPCHN
jgi:hypothetical protein